MAKEKKYIIELNETQLHLIADCVEDCHRFASGQTELHNTGAHSTMKNGNYGELSDALRELHYLVTPELPYNASYGWDGSTCPDDTQRRFIAQTYPIYRQILHFFACQQEDNDWNVYRSETLTCKEGGELIKIRVKNKNKWTARDNGHIEEIITHLSHVEKECFITLSDEKNWLRTLKDRMEG